MLSHPLKSIFNWKLYCSSRCAETQNARTMNDEWFGLILYHIFFRQIIIHYSNARAWRICHRFLTSSHTSHRTKTSGVKHFRRQKAFDFSKITQNGDFCEGPPPGHDGSAFRTKVQAMLKKWVARTSSWPPINYLCYVRVIL